MFGKKKYTSFKIRPWLICKLIVQYFLMLFLQCEGNCCQHQSVCQEMNFSKSACHFLLKFWSMSRPDNWLDAAIWCLIRAMEVYSWTRTGKYVNTNGFLIYSHLKCDNSLKWKTNYNKEWVKGALPDPTRPPVWLVDLSRYLLFYNLDWKIEN